MLHETTQGYVTKEDENGESGCDMETGGHTCTNSRGDVTSVRWGKQSTGISPQTKSSQVWFCTELTMYLYPKQDLQRVTLVKDIAKICAIIIKIFLGNVQLIVFFKLRFPYCLMHCRSSLPQHLHLYSASYWYCTQLTLWIWAGHRLSQIQSFLLKATVCIQTTEWQYLNLQVKWL